MVRYMPESSQGVKVKQKVAAASRRWYEFRGVTPQLLSSPRNSGESIQALSFLFSVLIISNVRVTDSPRVISFWSTRNAATGFPSHFGNISKVSILETKGTPYSSAVKGPT
jgi:hypothetical protein